MNTPLLFISSVLMISLAACSEPAPKEDSAPLPVASLPAEEESGYRYATFEIIDSTGKRLGTGYDIYSGSKRMIHQSTIPGEPGIGGFVNTEEAERVARLVISKLESNSGFPTVTRIELDSLNITLQSNSK